MFRRGAGMAGAMTSTDIAAQPQQPVAMQPVVEHPTSFHYNPTEPHNYQV
jgi:hypothetical protein